VTSRPIAHVEPDWERHESKARPCEDDEDSEFIREKRRTWARLLAEILEVDPMLCSCGAQMKIISITTEPRAADCREA